MNHRLARAALLAIAAPASLAAQSSAAPAGVLDLVVALRSIFADSSEDFGSGIIVAVRGDTVYVATARHVVVRAGQPARSVTARFLRDSATARPAVVRNVAGQSLDLALLAVVTRRAPVPPLDRLGQARQLRFGDPVRSIGCPNERCWRQPGEADALMALDGGVIGFQSSFVQQGSSGGALFNRWWEVVGLVYEDEPPRANAISIDEVMAALRAWGVPAGLRRAAIPRAGYRHTISAMPLGFSEAPFSRVPAGRITYGRRAAANLSWHTGLMRLTENNRSVNAAVGGIGALVRRGRFGARPFVELTMVRVEGRYDLGGYYQGTVGGSQYVPVWSHTSRTGLGVGTGLVLDWIIHPPIMIEVMVGRWSFSAPDSLPGGTAGAIGVGLRWGQR